MESEQSAIDIYFPKGKDKRRGQALIVFAEGHIDGRQERDKEILKIIFKWWNKSRCNSKYSIKAIVGHQEFMEELKKQIKEMQNAS